MRNMKRLVATACATLIVGMSSAWAETIQVVVWDERQEEQRQAYDDGYLGDYIAEQLAQHDDFEVLSVGIDDEDMGLGDDILDNCDVLLWWGHVRHGDVPQEKAREIAERIQAGDFAFLAIHSSHFARPFVEAIGLITQEQALADVADELDNTPRIELDGPHHVEPSWELTEEDGEQVLRITLPNGGLGGVRADAEPSRMDTVMPEHPIAEGVPESFEISESEMYDELFGIPEPDALIFDEHFSQGEYFRSGVLWNLGEGQVFYFRPGHETYPKFKDEYPMRIIENATRYMGQNIR